VGSHLRQRAGALVRVPLPWLQLPLSTWLILALARVVVGALTLVATRSGPRPIQRNWWVVQHVD
jgi:hypothetical protein